jgi:hypothetical protein
MPVIEHLGADHEDLLSRAGDVRRLLRAGRGKDASAAFVELVLALRQHTTVEEAGLFTGLRAAGEMVDAVAALAEDHLAVWRTVERLDPHDAGWDAAVTRLLDDLHDHIAREEYDLFPASLIAIGPADWDAVEAAASEARHHVH